MVRLSTLALAASFLSTSPSVVAGLSAADIPSDTPISSLLASAQSHLSRGETNDALVYYDAALARDPNNYLTLFKRATTYLSLGRTTQATEDFNKVLTIKPGFEGAHAQLGRIRARGGDWDGAKKQYILARKDDELAALEEAKGAALLAEAAAKKGNWEECANQAGEAILVASRSLPLRELRARCNFESGHAVRGIADLQHVLQMRPGDTAPHVRISAVTFYGLGDVQEGMAAIRKCLHSDPDSKVCKKLLRQEKNVEKALQKITKALEKNQPTTAARQLVPTGEDEGLIKEVKDQVKALREDGTIPLSVGDALVSRLVAMACQAYYESSSKRAKEYCAESLSLDENSFYGLLHQGKTQLEAEDYDASINTLKKAQESAPESKRSLADQLLRDAEIALKRSKTKDYYKVLGVAHDADERQIKSAYRKLSKQHHPDKAAKQGLTKEDAEKKMASINEAYEVLSDPELRARFDRGDDPNSHEQQGFNQGHPFGGGGHPFFQQGGGNFKFQSGGFPGGGFQFGF
ncbi:hypothetical protein B0T16DRAFT_456271 [Cercophora newfieldiana]|uniref:Tetratricopeptide repeat and J domain-containing co-chaperone DNJ1 n=1 Tax=Cercophora newfieldiana TaxID=92897 RepID=A0AA40CTK6_9PEZI|nr:hypothetical protein B0T16DRAFT_456271 [Cercophora newfieldiana]